MRIRRILGAAAALVCTAASLGQDVVISQVYGGGGNTAAPFSHDFVELFNRSANPVTLVGYSLQYASTAGSSWQVNALPGSVTIQPGQYYLVQMASNNVAVGSPLPTPDFIVTTAPINMAGANGKIALVNIATAMPNGTCPTAAAVDFVGYGTANCAEGLTVSPLSNTTSAVRGNNGCTDTNNNRTDFAVLPVSPRNSASPTNTCTASTPPSGSGAANPNPACRSSTVVMTVAVTLGAGPAAPIASVIGDTSAIGGGPGVAFLDDGVAPDSVAGDGTYSAQETIDSATAFANHSVPVVITDNLGRSGNAGVPVTVTNCDPSGFGTANPAGTCAGNTTLVRVTVTPGILPPSTGLQVFVDLTAIGDPATNLFDDGTNGDVVAGDNVFSYLATVAPSTLAGTYNLAATILDAQGRVGLTSLFSFTVVPCTDSGATLVISQVYGGGGNSGSTFFHDFIELYNRSNSPIDLTGLSLQLAGSSAPFDRKADLSGVIPARGYFLVRCSRGTTGGTSELPVAADLLTPESGTGAMTVGSTNGRVALVSDTVLLGADCATATTILDLVGYGGGTTCAEGSTAPGTSNPVALFRSLDGCQDFNQNIADFVIAPPAPRNSASPVNLCGATPSCPQDFNNDGDVNPDDLGDYINCYFSVPPCDGADVNDDGDVNPDDLGDFINLYFGPAC